MKTTTKSSQEQQHFQFKLRQSQKITSNEQSHKMSENHNGGSKFEQSSTAYGQATTMFKPMKFQIKIEVIRKFTENRERE